VAGLSERRHRGSGRGRQGHEERSRRRFQHIMKSSAQQEIKARTRKKSLNARLFK